MEQIIINFLGARKARNLIRKTEDHRLERSPFSFIASSIVKKMLDKILNN